MIVFTQPDVNEIYHTADQNNVDTGVDLQLSSTTTTTTSGHSKRGTTVSSFLDCLCMGNWLREFTMLVSSRDRYLS